MKYIIESVQHSPATIDADSPEEAIREYVLETCDGIDTIPLGETSVTIDMNLWVRTPSTQNIKYTASTVVSVNTTVTKKDWS